MGEGEEKQPHHDLTPNPEKPPRITLSYRSTPWHIRIGEHDLFVQVDCDEDSDPIVGPELTL